MADKTFFSPLKEIMLEMEQHPRYQEWCEYHRTRIVLLGGSANGWGSRSHTYQLAKSGESLKGTTYCADTLEPVSNYFDRFSQAYGAKRFFEWVTPEGNNGGNDGEETPK